LGISSRKWEVSALKHGYIPTQLRQSSYFPDGYYRLRAFHPELGDIVLCVTPYIEAGTHCLKYWVYICSNPERSCATIRHEYTLRWKIEQMFKVFKHVLGIRFYHGLSDNGQQCWVALTCLRFLFAQLAVKFSLRFPTLRWRLPSKNFSLNIIIRFIRNHYYLDSNSKQIKHLHYAILPQGL